ncbi:YqaA family protein, partial [Pseudomonas aeruginosa]
FEQVAERYNELGWLMVLLGGGFTPLPYKVITITSGVTQLDLWLFVGLSLVARSLRFAATCALLFWAGPRLKTLIERRLGMAFVLMAVMVIGGVMLGKFVL